MRITKYISVILLAVCFSGAAMQTDTYVAAEYEIKAVFLYQFTKFVEWPSGSFSSASSPLILGIIGDDPFGQYLDDVIRDETIDGRPLQVTRISSPDKAAGNCHVLFISSSEKRHLGDILQKLDNNSILTVGDSQGYAAKGVMINLYSENQKIRFEINRAAAEQAGLKISSKLLRLANLVEGSNGK